MQSTKNSETRKVMQSTTLPSATEEQEVQDHRLKIAKAGEKKRKHHLHNEVTTIHQAKKLKVRRG